MVIVYFIVGIGLVYAVLKKFNSLGSGCFWFFGLFDFSVSPNQTVLDY